MVELIGCVGCHAEPECNDDNKDYHLRMQLLSAFAFTFARESLQL